VVEYGRRGIFKQVPLRGKHLLGNMQQIKLLPALPMPARRAAPPRTPGNKRRNGQFYISLFEFVSNYTGLCFVLLKEHKLANTFADWLSGGVYPRCDGGGGKLAPDQRH
jgi:hypothetical protein